MEISGMANKRPSEETADLSQLHSPQPLHSSSLLPHLSPQQIADLEEQWRVSRTKLTLFQQPKKTISLFLSASFNVLKNTFLYLISHPVLLKFLLPLLVLWYVLEFIPGFYTDTINEIEFWIQYIVWWIGLGILSSIGLGSGLQTGVLFLFPHIMRVCITAQTCKSVNFNSFGAIWFRSADSHNLFKCYEEPAPSQPPPAFLSVWFLVLIPSFLQSTDVTGTAIGEIPPYWMTRAARQAAIDAGEKMEVPEELEANSQYNIVNRLKAKLISFLRSHGFLGVFLMASWPNFAFDLCGICCGHFLMPFWTFFGATFLGKACVRNTYQTLILVALFNEDHLNTMIQLAQSMVPDRFHGVVETYLREALDEMKNSAHKEHAHDASNSSGQSYLAILWGTLMSLVLLFFFLSCINQFAQLYQALLDKDKIEEFKQLLPTHIQKELTCTMTGKILLPPPTSHSVHQMSLTSLAALSAAASPATSQSSTPANSAPSTPQSIKSITSHHSEILFTPEGSSPSLPRRAISFNSPPRHKSEYSPGNAFVLAVIDGNRHRQRPSLSPSVPSPPPATTASSTLINRKEGSAPLVVRKTNLFNFATGTLEDSPQEGGGSKRYD